MGPPFFGFPFQEHPSVPFVLAFTVPETEVPDTDDPETEVLETDDPETDDPEVHETDVSETDSADGWRRDGRCALSTLCMVLVTVTV